MIIHFTTDAEMVGRLEFAHLAVRQHFSPVKSRDFTVKVCNPETLRWTESNHRDQVCVVLAEHRLAPQRLSGGRSRW
jgi:hypothetical protein